MDIGDKMLRCAAGPCRQLLRILGKLLQLDSRFHLTNTVTLYAVRLD